jgi:DNA polymerase-3 subunit epsilon
MGGEIGESPMNGPDRPRAGIWELYRMGGLRPALRSVFEPQTAQQMAFIRSMIKDQRREAAYSMRLKELNAVVFDLETTGYYPEQGDEIIAIGAVSVNGTEIDEQEPFYTLIDPERSVPPEVQAITGITDEMTQHAPKRMVGLRAFLEFADSKVLIAHGMRHDKRFLNRALWTTSRTGLPHRTLDTMMIAALLYPEEAPYTLEPLLQRHGIAVHGRHHALQDALMAAKLWCAMSREMMDRGLETLGDVYEELNG